MLELAQQHFEQGRLIATIELLAPLAGGGLPAPLVAKVEHLRCVSAYRLGQLDVSLQSTRAFLKRVDPGIESTLEQRFAVLAVAVVAAGELAQYEQSLEHLTELLGLASRLGGLAHYVRARGTAASAFFLLGDPWAAQRILSALTSEFDREHDELRLETTMRCNHASLCLQVARMARDADDPDASQQSLQDAQASLDRAVLAAQRLQDLRLVTFVQLHQIELSLLQGRHESAWAHLDKATVNARAAGLNAHWRHLELLRAELLLGRGAGLAALDVLDGLRRTETPGHELSERLLLRELEFRALQALGRDAAALKARVAFDQLHAYRAFRQARAQSALMRKRLELEHLFQRSSGHKAFGPVKSPGPKLAASPALAPAPTPTPTPTQAPGGPAVATRRRAPRPVPISQP